MKKKFTLIELLVVVSIIGILTSILMPSLHKARLKAQQAVCVSNSKQSGYALTMFLDEKNEYFPPNKVSGTSDESIWKGKTGSTLTIPHDKRSLNPYLGQPDSKGEMKDAYCPSEKGGFYESKGNSYAAHVFGGKALKSTLQLSAVLQPARVIAMAEVGGIRAESVAGVDSAEFYWHTPFGDTRWVTVFVDGHARPIKYIPGQRNAKLYTFRYDNVWSD
jgi:prepilin-type N-terminal cleavage/methylation domain-containing protein